MNLLEIRTKFVEASGRMDLGDFSSANTNSEFSIYSEDGTSAFFPRVGADYYINAAQQYLDNELELPEHDTCFFIELKAQENTYIFPNVLRYVKQVTWNNALLKRCGFDLRKLRTSVGNPVSWCFMPTRCIYNKFELQKSVGKYTWFNDDYVKSSDRCTVIAILPKPAIQGQLSVYGVGYTPPLIEDSDTSVWTLKYPDMLLTASLMTLEKFYRNTEGFKDYKTALDVLIENARTSQLMQDQTFLGENYESF